MKDSFILDFNLTPEKIQEHIINAFDSVNLLNKFSTFNSLTEDQIESKERNIQHLKTMINFEWFKNALTEEQTTIINQLIA